MCVFCIVYSVWRLFAITITIIWTISLTHPVTESLSSFLIKIKRTDWIKKQNRTQLQLNSISVFMVRPQTILDLVAGSEPFSLSLSILVCISVYLGSARFILIYFDLELSRAISDENGISWAILGYYGLSWAISAFTWI